MTNMAGVSVLVLILVLSFAIDRAAKAVLFLSSLFRGPWSRWLPDPQTLDDPAGRSRAEKTQTLAYYVLAGILALGVLAGFGSVRLIKALGYGDANSIVDWLVTGIVLIGGSELIGKLVQISGLGGGGEAKGQPLEITGKLILEDRSRKVE